MTDRLTESAREERISEALAAAESANHGTYKLRWKDGEELVLPIARVPLIATVLNPSSHRIRANLEALGDDANVVRSDPYNEQAQRLIETILRETGRFEEIKGALDRDRQRHPGVVTHKGVLVNANTRRVALADLGVNYIDVVVLPSDAAEREITDVELELQMETDVRQEYTFTARLLFIEELLFERGMSAAEIGMRLDRSLPDDDKGRRKATEFVEQEMRLLRLIREVVTASGGAQRITSFDDDRQELIEIDEDYERERRRNPQLARRVRDAQLAALLTDLGYKKMRDVDIELIDDYLTPALEDQPSLRPFIAELTTSSPGPENEDALSGLDLLDDQPDDSNGTGPDTTRLFSVLAGLPDDGELVLTGAAAGEDSSPALPRDTVVAGVKSAFTMAIESKRRDSRAVDALDAPCQHLADAARSIDRARSTYADVGSDPDFDVAAFSDAAAQLVRAFDEFQQARD